MGWEKMFGTYITGKKSISSRICKESFLSNRKTEYLIKTDNSHTTKEAQMINKHITTDYQTLKCLITSSDSKDKETCTQNVLLVRGVSEINTDVLEGNMALLM